MGSPKRLYLPFKREQAESVERVLDFLSLRMYKSTSTYPRTLMELYKYVFDYLDPNDCRNILASWISVVKKTKSSMLDQKDPWWPDTAERTDVLFFILCGDHGQPVPFRSLYQALQSPVISSSARDILTMAIILRRSQSWWLSQLSILNDSPRAQQTPSLTEDKECLTTDSYCQGSPCLSLNTLNQTAPVCYSTLPSCMLQWAPSNTVMAQQTRIPDEEFTHSMVKPLSYCPNHSAFEPQTPFKTSYAKEPLFDTEGSFFQTSNGGQKSCDSLEISVYQDVKHLNRDEWSAFPNSSGAKLEITTKSSRVQCEVPGCTKSFTKQYNMKRHMQIHLKKDLYACGIPECRRAFTRSDGLRSHIKHKHSLQGSRGRYVSPLDGTSPDCNPYRPISNEHRPHANRGSQCRHIPSKTNSSGNLLHDYTSLDGVPTKEHSYPSSNTIIQYAASPPPSLALQQSKSTHRAQNQATSHSLIHYHEDPSPYIPVAAHQSKRYTCSKCHQTCISPSQLRVHDRSHTGIKPFQCSNAGCKKRFSVQSNARRHERQCTRVGSTKAVVP